MYQNCVFTDDGSYILPEVPERHRRITVRKFRKEWSEGLLMPATDFPRPMPELTGNLQWSELKEGDDVSDLIGITHYDPDKGKERTTGENERGPSTVRKWPRSLKGWFYFLLHKIGLNLNGDTHGWDREGSPIPVPVYDVDALKNFKDVFQPGELVTVTEKIHGSNGRFVYVNGKQYVGSRTLWKSEKSSCVWRKALEQNPWIGEWCRANEGSVLFGEVVPTQGDKYMYGCEPGQVKFFPFDIRTKEGEWKKPYPYPTNNGWGNVGLSGKTPPILYEGPFDLEKIMPLVDGKSVVDGKTQREGVVINPQVERHERGLGRVQLKIVSNAFLEADSK